VILLIRRLLRDKFNEIDKARYGRCKRVSKEEKLFRKIEQYLEKWINYIDSSDVFKDKNNPTNRNSYSKTDRDATFMRIKENHMRNAQLKPARYEQDKKEKIEMKAY